MLLHYDYIYMHTCAAANFGAQCYSGTSLAGNLRVCMLRLFVKLHLKRWYFEIFSWEHDCNYA